MYEYLLPGFLYTTRRCPPKCGLTMCLSVVGASSWRHKQAALVQSPRLASNCMEVCNCWQKVCFRWLHIYAGKISKFFGITWLLFFHFLIFLHQTFKLYCLWWQDDAIFFRSRSHLPQFCPFLLTFFYSDKASHFDPLHRKG